MIQVVAWESSMTIGYYCWSLVVIERNYCYHSVVVVEALVENLIEVIDGRHHYQHCSVPRDYLSAVVVSLVQWCETMVACY